MTQNFQNTNAQKHTTQISILRQLFVLPGNFLVRNEALVIIDLITETDEDGVCCKLTFIFIIPSLIPKTVQKYNYCSKK